MIAREKLAKMSLYDLKLCPGFSELAARRISLEEGYREPGTDHIRSTYAVSFPRRVPSLRCSLPRKPIREELLLLGSVSCYGFRPTHLSREPARHRSLSECTTSEAVSLRTQWASQTILACRCQRTP